MAKAIGEVRLKKEMQNGVKGIALEVKTSEKEGWGLDTFVPVHNDEFIPVVIVDKLNHALDLGYKMVCSFHNEW